MGVAELFLLAVGLSMDAFAVAVCKGFGMKKITVGKSFIVGGYFGVFQGVMPLLGYLFASIFKEGVMSVGNWIACVLLCLIGVNMIREAFEKGNEETPCEEASLGIKSMLILSVATSIDAFAVGVSFALVEVKIVPAVLCIGITTFLISALGVKIGNVFGVKYKSKAELTGGIILILIGIKVVIENYTK